jgi:hypothetical protein
MGNTVTSTLGFDYAYLTIDTQQLTPFQDQGPASRAFRRVRRKGLNCSKAVAFYHGRPLPQVDQVF